MLKKIKSILGIEGVKVNLDIQPISKEGKINGVCTLVSATSQRVDSLKFRLEELYQRGRGKSKRTDTYMMVEEAMILGVELAPDLPVEVPFELDYRIVDAPIDKMAEDSLPGAAFAWIAKKVKAAKSTYILTAEALVHGNRLKPFDRVELDL